jgi:hypothetical protein
MGRGVLDDENVWLLVTATVNIVNNFLSGVLETTPTIGANGASLKYWRRRNWFQSLNWIVLDFFFDLCTLYFWIGCLYKI